MCEKPLNPNLPHWKRSNVDSYIKGYADGRYGQPKNPRSNLDEKYQQGHDRGSVVKGKIEEAPLGKNFFAQALEAIMGAPLPFCVASTSTNGMVGADYHQLQDWCSYHGRPSWATGLA